MPTPPHRLLYDRQLGQHRLKIGNLSRAIYDESGEPLRQWIISKAFDGETISETIARLLHNEMKKEQDNG